MCFKEKGFYDVKIELEKKLLLEIKALNELFKKGVSMRLIFGTLLSNDFHYY